MPLVPGVRLGAYEIGSLIGSGGMGEVYRARDVRLGRDVAVKVLPAGLATDAQRLQRFEQEARAAAALNHPNILAVFDIGQHEGAPYIVAELLDGETLRERLVDGTPPVRKAVEYAIQLALGLAAAHEKGIVHRDLKPENIFITSDGRVKILDFGLAKLTQDESRAASLSVLPTTPPNTLPGVVLGTAGYMSPEQVRGLPADHRADVFACGVVFYEMLSGSRAFRGDTAMDAMTAILREHPADLPFADRRIPATLGRIVDRCIEKNPAERFQSARDVAFALEALSTHSDRGTLQPGTVDEPHSWRGSRTGHVFKSARVAWSIAVLALALASALLATLLRRSPAAAETPPIRISILPVGSEVPTGVNPIALSPDGRQLAIASGGALWIRRLDEIAARPLAGTEGAQTPFWSPDGRFVGYFARGRLHKIPVAGGAAITLCDAEFVPAGATWNRDDVILFAMVSGPADRRPNTMPVQRVPASGGKPHSISTPNEQRGEVWHVWPEFLPDGRHFLYFATGPRDPKGIYLGSIDSPDTRLLVEGGSNARYANGQLLYLRATTLFAQPFDADALELRGEPVQVAEHVRIGGSTGVTGAFTVSSRGVLVYQTGENVPRLAWFDPSGKLVPFGEPRSYNNVSLSPNNARASVTFVDPVAGARDIWLVDTVNGSPTRFTFHAADENTAIWSPDGSRIVFNSNRSGHFDLYEKPSNLAGPEELLFADDSEKYPLSWSSDGQYVLFQSASGGEDSGVHVWVLPLIGDRKPFRLLQGVEIDGHAQFSPDGRWVAYATASVSRTDPRNLNQSGRPEVFVSKFPGAVGQWQISIGGGTQPRWSPDAKEIYYLGVDARVMAVPVAMRRGALEVGTARPLFALFLPAQPAPASGRIGRQPLFSYDVGRDSQRFLVRTILQETAPITLVANWPALLTEPR